MLEYSQAWERRFVTFNVKIKIFYGANIIY